MLLEIRILAVEDALNYKKLRLKSLLESPLAFSESYEDECKKTISEFEDELKTIGFPEECFVLGVFSTENDLIGFVKFKRDQRSKARHKAMLQTMYVDSSHRGQGIGKNLLNFLFQQIDTIDGLEQIHLWVLHSENSASDFYKNSGFEAQGTLVKKDLKIGQVYVDAEYLVKYLF